MAKFSHALPDVSKTVETEGETKVPGKEIDHCKIGDEYAVYLREFTTKTQRSQRLRLIRFDFVFPLCPLCLCGEFS